MGLPAGRPSAADAWVGWEVGDGAQGMARPALWKVGRALRCPPKREPPDGAQRIARPTLWKVGRALRCPPKREPPDGAQRIARPTLWKVGRALRCPPKREPPDGAQRIARPTLRLPMLRELASLARFGRLGTWTCRFASNCRTRSRRGCLREAGSSSPSSAFREARTNFA